MCSAAVREMAPVGIFATSSLHLRLVSKNTRDQSFETKSKTGNAETKTKTKTGSVNTKTKTKTAKKRSRVVSRPRPRSRGLHHCFLFICNSWQMVNNQMHFSISLTYIIMYRNCRMFAVIMLICEHYVHECIWYVLQNCAVVSANWTTWYLQ